MERSCIHQYRYHKQRTKPQLLGTISRIFAKEIVIDQIEKMDVNITVSGQVDMAILHGKILIKHNLPGNYDAHFRIIKRELLRANSSPIVISKETAAPIIQVPELEDATFHPSVNIFKFKDEGKCAFRLTENCEMVLMRYKMLLSATSLPFEVTASALRDIDKQLITTHIKLVSKYDANISAENVILTLNLPTNTISCKSSNNGVYKCDVQHVTWTFASLPGLKEKTVTSEARYEDDSSWNRIVTLSWRNLLWNSSGLLIRDLKIPQYHAAEAWTCCYSLAKQFQHHI